MNTDRQTRKSALPAVPSDTPAQLRRFLDAVRQFIDTGLAAQPNASVRDKLLRVGDLLDTGLVELSGGSRRVTRLQPTNADAYDASIPQAVTNVSAYGALSSIMVTWDDVALPSGAYFEVWRSSVDDVGQASMIGSSIAPLYVDNIGGQGAFYYWVRIISAAGIAGPFNAVAGTYGETGTDPSYVLSILAGQITESELYQALNDRINNIDSPNTGLLDRTSALEAADGQINQALSLLDVRTGDVESFARVLDEIVGETALELIVAADKEKYDRYQTQGEVVRLYDAVFNVDPNTGEITATGLKTEVDELGATVNSVLAELSAQEAQINLKADKTYVDTVAATILEGIQPLTTWEFSESAEGWVGSNATVAQANSAISVVATGVSPGVDSPVTVFDGGAYTRVVMSIRRTNGTGWLGRVYYATDGHPVYDAVDGTYVVGDYVQYDDGTGAAVWECKTNVPTPEPFDPGRWVKLGAVHGFSSSLYKSFPEPAQDGAFKVVSVDMSSLDAGGDSWTKTAPSAVRIVLGADIGDDFEVDYVQIAKPAIDQGALTDLEARVQTAELNIDANAAEVALRAYQTDLNALDARLQSAESYVDANKGMIVDAVSSVARDLAVQGEAALDSLLQENDQRYLTRENQYGVATVRSELKAQADLLTAEVTARETLAAELNTTAQTLSAAIDNEASIRLSQVAAEVQAREALEARVGDAEGEIVNIWNLNIDGNTALASTLTGLRTDVDNNTATVTQQAQSIDGLEAQWTVKVDVNGEVAGIGLAAANADDSGVSSSFIVNADKFAVTLPSRKWAANMTVAVNDIVRPTTASDYVYQAVAVTGPTGSSEPIWPVPSGSTPATVVDGGVTWESRPRQFSVPFTVTMVNGQPTVTIDTAVIADASIQDAKIGTVAADKLIVTQPGSTIADVIIGQGHITNAMIGNTIQSDNYTPATQGWVIKKDGTAEFNDMSFYGGLQSSDFDDVAQTGWRIDTRTGLVKFYKGVEVWADTLRGDVTRAKAYKRGRSYVNQSLLSDSNFASPDVYHSLRTIYIYGTEPFDRDVVVKDEKFYVYSYSDVEFTFLYRIVEYGYNFPPLVVASGSYVVPDTRFSSRHEAVLPLDAVYTIPAGTTATLRLEVAYSGVATLGITTKLGIEASTPIVLISKTDGDYIKVF